MLRVGLAPGQLREMRRKPWLALSAIEWAVEQLLATANRLAIIGMAALAAGVACSIFVVTDVIFGRASAAGVAVGTGAFFAVLWYGLALPLRTRLRS